MSQNPLLSDYHLPPFDRIQPTHIVEAIQQRIAACKTTIEQVLERGDFSWEGLVVPLEQVDDLLERSWSPVSHLNAVMSEPALRQAHDQCLPLLSEYSTYVGQHEGLYQAFKQLRESAEYEHLNAAQQQVVKHTLRDFELSGIALPKAQKQRYAEIQAQLSELASTFSNQLLDATDGWHLLVTDESQLAGLPETAVQAARAAAEEHQQQGWRFGLDFPSYQAVMTYADSPELRRTLYEAYTTRASDMGPQAGQFDNSAIMNQILALRHELAQLLGFANYAELSLATKMAESTEQVEQFLEDLARRSLPQAQQEYQEVVAFAQQLHGMSELNAWDVAYYSEKLKQQHYAISDEQLRPYFPEHQVVKGLFQVVERLFGLRIEEQSAVTWHPQVRYFVIFDQDNNLRGSFYLDLYARSGKRGGAWMAECAVRRLTAQRQLQHPVAYLTCNFSRPVDGKPALFTHDEVITLFHEFGHGLHHMLTKVDVAGVSGINGVAWDAVELPSQFLENWCWEPQALALISGHFETGAPLPQELLERMLAARNFQSAMQMVRQLEFSLFDLRIHRDYHEGVDEQFIQRTLNEVRRQVAVVFPPAYNRFQHSFAHIFAGGYAAGYYSYKWAEVLSADAFARFEEEGIFNRQTGQDFMRAILEQGGSRDAMELFKQFRGRDPQIDALLRHSGIMNSAPPSSQPVPAQAQITR